VNERIFLKKKTTGGGNSIGFGDNVKR